MFETSLDKYLGPDPSVDSMEFKCLLCSEIQGKECEREQGDNVCYLCDQKLKQIPFLTNIFGKCNCSLLANNGIGNPLSWNTSHHPKCPLHEDNIYPVPLTKLYKILLSDCERLGFDCYGICWRISHLSHSKVDEETRSYLLKDFRKRFSEDFPGKAFFPVNWDLSDENPFVYRDKERLNYLRKIIYLLEENDGKIN